MNVHPSHIGLTVTLDHTQEFPVISFIEADVVGHQIGRRDTLGPQIFHSHVQEISSNRTATEMYDHLTSQLAEQEGITEQLKVTDQWDWVQRMNSVRNRAAEVVWKELICV